MNTARRAARRVAIVEDDDTLAVILRYNINAAGCSVDWIPHGRQALAQILQKPPDLVMLDWMLPGLAGIEVLSALRANPSTRRLPA